MDDMSIFSKKIIYQNKMDVERCETESRQNIIKQFLINDDIDINGEIFNELLSQEVDIEEGTMLSGKKCIKVVSDYKNVHYELGYIPQKYEKELYDEITGNRGYSVDLYVTKKDGVFKARVKIMVAEL